MTIPETARVERAEPLLRASARALGAAAELLARATDAVRALVTRDGAIERALLEREQHAVHGLAWLATYVEALRQLQGWAQRLDAGGQARRARARAARGRLRRVSRPDRGRHPDEPGRDRPARVRSASIGRRSSASPQAAGELIEHGNSAAGRARLAALIADGRFGDWALEDETLELIREQFRRFAEEQVAPHAQGWHERDELIPDQVVEAVAGLGVFGLTIPEAHGGLGLGKAAMCVVTEELSRGYIGVGSLGTRSEIAAELIRAAGTEAQKERYLPKIAAGEILPTAVFTEPNTGSDLAALQTRAVLEGEHYRVSGAKVWITHAARADLMTILCRTDPAKEGYPGLSILLAEKPRGTRRRAVPGRGPVGRRDPRCSATAA